MSHPRDWSWSVEALYACPCGSLVAAQRWRWIDARARPDLVAAVRANGPFVGACARCGRPAAGGGAWIELAPDEETATLVLSADRRGDLIAALQAHLSEVEARAAQAAPWLLQPAVAFAPTPSPWADPDADASPAPWPAPTGARDLARDLPGEGSPQPDTVSGPELLEDTLEETSPKGRAPTGERAASGPSEPAEDPSMHDTLPGRRRPRKPETREVPGATGHDPKPSAGSGPRPAATLDGVSGPRSTAPRPAAVLAASETNMSGGPGRRPAAVLAASETNMSGGAGRRPSAALAASETNMSGGAGPRPSAVLEAGETNMSAGAGRRPAAVLEAGEANLSAGAARANAPEAAAERAGRAPAGSGLFDGPGGRRRAGAPEADARGPAEEPGVGGERSSLHAAVARALTTPPGQESSDSGPRPAGVLPGPGAEMSAADTGIWPKRQGDAGDSGPFAGVQVDASTSGAWLKRQGEAGEGGAWPRRQAGEEAEATRGAGAGRSPTPPPLRLGPEVQRAGLAALGRVGEAVTVTATMNEATARVWATAPVKVRPIHLRGLGYPLVGVRCVAEVGSEALIVDAIVDVGAPTTLEIFKQLTREFRVRLVAGGGAVDRELLASELQRNAAACLESAQAQLGAGEFPHDAFRTACEALVGLNAAQRLEPARAQLQETLGEGCRASPGTAWAALARLEQASRKDNLSRLLEVDGLSIETYEKIRAAVLAAAIEFGLPAPARFWRRWLGSSQARDVGAFVQRLIAARAASIARGEDLAADEVEAAWRGILDLCQHKNLTPPPDVSRALGLGKVSAGRRPSQPQIKVAAEVREPPAVQEGARSAARRRELAARLRGSASDRDLRAVVGALSELAEADVIALLPALAELGGRLVPELLAALRAPQRHVRQAAAILLGQLGERKAEGPLVAMLGEEPSAGWVDAAVALGNLGPRVVGPLCTLLRSPPAGRKDSVGLRVARALVELIKAEGAGPGGPARQAVENLLEVGDLSVSSAARRALATLTAVRDEIDGDDAEASRQFSRLASDAIAPELDAAVDDEFDEVDVEVGD